jgi:hypothetical protein
MTPTTIVPVQRRLYCCYVAFFLFMQCTSVVEHRECDKGDTCSFAHGLMETNFHPAVFKRRLCNHWSKDKVNCTLASASLVPCHNAHSEEEMAHFSRLYSFLGLPASVGDDVVMSSCAVDVMAAYAVSPPLGASDECRAWVQDLQAKRNWPAIVAGRSRRFVFVDTKVLAGDQLEVFTSVAYSSAKCPTFSDSAFGFEYHTAENCPDKYSALFCHNNLEFFL